MKKARAPSSMAVPAQIAVQRGLNISEAAINTGIFVVGRDARSHDGAASFVIPNASLP